MAMTMINTCSTCHYWVPGDEPGPGGAPQSSDHGWGECRIQPPRVLDVAGQAKTLFPITTGELGCGEFALASPPPEPPSPPAP